MREQLDDFRRNARKYAADAFGMQVDEEVRQQFDEKALVDLTLAIVAINGWNRLAVSFQAQAGSYQPPGVATR